MNSYVYMDRDALFNALQITEENLDTMGYTKETFGLTLPTYFYINGSNDIHNTILTKLQDICRQNAIDYNKIAVTTANDAANRVSEVYGYMDVLLSVFTIINFLMACFIICYLVYLFLINHIQVMNVLRILGLSKIKNTFLMLLIVMVCLIIPIFLGLILGYFMML